MFGFATTKCGKCENRTFKLQELSLKSELDSKVISVQCAYCKTPIGVFEYNNVFQQQQQMRMFQIERRLSSIDDKLSEIASALSQRALRKSG
jgi:predicted nucleic-acid-binding Zn-ribbon protein